MAGMRLFRPNEGLNVPSVTDTRQEVGNIVNPPNFAQFGGLDGPSLRGLKRNDKTIALPQGAVMRAIPQKNK